MAGHQGNEQSPLVLPDYPATTEGLSGETVLQHLLQTEKVNGLQTTNISAPASQPGPHLLYPGYSQLVDYQTAAVDRQSGGTESLVLHTGLTGELRALQMEGGFDTTSDLLHHLVVSERVKRIQLQQRMTSRCSSHGSRDCPSPPTTLPALVQSAAANAFTDSSTEGPDRLPGPCSLQIAGENVRLCSISLEGATSKGGRRDLSHDGGGQSTAGTASVGVQASLCQCRPEDESGPGQGNRCKGSASKVKTKKRRRRRKNSAVLQDEKEEADGSLKSVLVKELLQSAKGHIRKRARGRGLPDYPRQRLPRDTKTATREKQEYLCEICGATFKWRRSLIPHMWEHRNQASVHRCPHCSTSFPYACRLKRHLVAKHPEHAGGPIRCATCGVEVQSYHTLKSHMRIHTGYRPFKCKFCPKTYKWNTGLEYHERVHTGERPYPCPNCPKAFTNKSDLTRHQTVHTGEKPHVCATCGKGFTQSHTLKSHCKKHHPAADLQLHDAGGGGKPCPAPLQGVLAQSFQSGTQAAFMLGGLPDPTAPGQAMEPMKFPGSGGGGGGGLHSLQRQMPGVPTDREIAEVVVNMLTQ